MLGIMYAEGQGVAWNYLKGYSWLCIVAAQSGELDDLSLDEIVKTVVIDMAEAEGWQGTAGCQMHEMYEARLARAKETGELSTDLSIPMAAKYIDAQLLYLYAQNARGEDHGAIREIGTARIDFGSKLIYQKRVTLVYLRL